MSNLSDFYLKLNKTSDIHPNLKIVQTLTFHSLTHFWVGLILTQILPTVMFTFSSRPDCEKALQDNNSSSSAASALYDCGSTGAASSGVSELSEYNSALQRLSSQQQQQDQHFNGNNSGTSSTSTTTSGSSGSGGSAASNSNNSSGKCWQRNCYIFLFCVGELTKLQNYRLKATQRTRWRRGEITGAEGKSVEMKSKKNHHIISYIKCVYTHRSEWVCAPREVRAGQKAYNFDIY